MIKKKLSLGKRTGKLDLSTKFNWNMKPGKPAGLSTLDRDGETLDDDEDALEVEPLLTDAAVPETTEHEQKEMLKEVKEMTKLPGDDRKANKRLEERNMALRAFLKELDKLTPHIQMSYWERNIPAKETLKNAIELWKSGRILRGVSIEPTDGVKSTLSRFERCKKNRIMQVRLSAIPREDFDMASLTELWLNNNSIESVPPQIADLKRLKVLSLSGNQLRSVVPEICLLENLERVYFQRNQLESLPDLFNRLRSLTDLNLSNNYFVEFPTILCQLKQLSNLNISANSISNFPMAMKNMRLLVTLNVSSNRIESPPEVMSHMHWCAVIGCPLLSGEKCARTWAISTTEAEDVEDFLRSKAAARMDRRKREAAAPGGILKDLRKKMPKKKIVLKKG